MSLIEEALRKQREEGERVQLAAPSAPAAGSPTPPPLPSSAQPESPTASPDVPPEKSNRTWRMLAGLAVVLLMATAIVIWMLMFGFRLFRGAPAPATVTVVPPTDAPTAIPAPALPVAALPPAETNMTTAAAPAAAGPETAIVQPAEASTTTTVAAAQSPPAMSGSAGAPTGTAETSKPVVIWPQINVRGIVGGGRMGRSAALINGQMMSPGDSVESARIVSIDKRGVTFTYSGETRTLTVGGSTE